MKLEAEEDNGDRGLALPATGHAIAGHVSRANPSIARATALATPDGAAPSDAAASAALAAAMVTKACGTSDGPIESCMPMFDTAILSK